jgi:hypothetical protein
MSTWLIASIRAMGDARHKGKYSKGKRIQMTDAWKQRVRDRLLENKRNDVAPRNQVELAEMIGAKDKSAITKMFAATSSKLVEPICALLQIPLPMKEQKEPDELELFIADLPEAKRTKALATLRLVFGD